MEIKKFGFFFLLGIILALAFKFYSSISGFIPAIATACVLAHLLNPIYLYFLKITRKRSISASFVLSIIFLVVLVPLIFLAFAIQKQVQYLLSQEAIEQLQYALQNFYDTLYLNYGIHLSYKSITNISSRLVTGFQETVTAFGPKMIVSITRLVLYVFVTFFLMFYLLKNSTAVVNSFRDYFPLSYRNCDILLKEMGKATKTLILGQLLIAVMQGSLGAIGFLVFGVPGAFLWGFAMMITSFIPFLGSVVVWLPACVVLLVKEEFFKCIGLFLWGMLIVGTSDNLIRPKLTSALGKIHPVTVLLGVFIGIKEWGFIGLVIGPLFISVLIILIKMFREEYLSE
ncbi:AI-2E family transporter [bacterium]|nr:AI-2E family transporter [bacterium]